MAATTTTRTITHKGEKWNILTSITEDDGSTAYVITRMCTGHWSGGQWVGGRHRVQGTITQAQYDAATR